MNIENDVRPIESAGIRTAFGHKNVLITGGLGFLGSSLANRLADLGAHVKVLDSLHCLYGGNEFNLVRNTRDTIEVVRGDVRDRQLLERMIEGADVIYHFAAQVSYIDSGRIPFEDLDVNQRATLQLLEICRERAPEAKVLFASSRLVVGEAQTTPVREDHPTSPQSMYGIHKLAAEKYCEIYWKNFGLRTTVLRITNPYGPRQQMKHGKYSMVGWFVRLAMEEREITIFGDGHQVRNYIYVDDIVDAFARCGATEGVAGQLYWLGSRENTPFRKMAEMVVEVVGRGSIRFVPWPANYERVETGTVVIDSSRLEQAIGWEAKVSLREGIKRTVDYYAQHLAKYIDANGTVGDRCL